MVLDFAKEAIDNAGTHSINFDELKAGKANIKVIGVGGMGCNAITWLYNKGISGATVYAANTDALHLSVSKSDEKILIGKELTRGLGAGGRPQVGREAAKEALAELKSSRRSRHGFVIAGEGAVQNRSISFNLSDCQGNMRSSYWRCYNAF
jgi:cell division GTPase FtsZ